MKGFIYDQRTLFGGDEVRGFGNQGGLHVATIPRSHANKLIVANHYSQKFYNASTIHLGIFQRDQLEGVLQFGYAMNPASQGSIVADTPIDGYLELNRMWIKDAMPRNTASQAISYSLKFIRRQHPKIQWIQSFADERCKRFGVVYQAANFIYLGEHTTHFWVLDGTYYHKSLMERDPSLTPAAAHLQVNKDRARREEYRQFRYIYFLKRSARRRLLLPERPYPKHADKASRENAIDNPSIEAGSIPAVRSI